MTKQEGEGGGGGGGGVGVYIEGSWGGERANLFSVQKWALKTRLKNMGN